MAISEGIKVLIAEYNRIKEELAIANKKEEEAIAATKQVEAKEISCIEKILKEVRVGRTDRLQAVFVIDDKVYTICLTGMVRGAINCFPLEK